VSADRQGSFDRSVESASVLARFGERMNQIRERELTAALKRLPGLTPVQRAAVGHLSQSLMAAFMAAPTAQLRATDASERGSKVVDAARYLFALGEGCETQATDSGDVRAA
jgi:glutamyl-tRNA reductase